MQPRRIACAFPRKSKMQLASRPLSLTTLVWGSTAAQSGNNHATLGLVSSLKRTLSHCRTITSKMPNSRKPLTRARH